MGSTGPCNLDESISVPDSAVCHWRNFKLGRCVHAQFQIDNHHEAYAAIRILETTSSSTVVSQRLKSSGNI